MNNSIDNQIELMEELIKNLGDYSKKMEEMISKYQEHILVLENTGLVKESLINLNDNYFPNTKSMLNNLEQNIQIFDIQDAKNILSQLEELKNSAIS